METFITMSRVIRLKDGRTVESIVQVPTYGGLVSDLLIAAVCRSLPGWQNVGMLFVWPDGTQARTVT